MNKGILNKEFSIDFKTALKMYPNEGNLVYEYNPFHNYRLDRDMYLYLGKFYTLKELELKGIKPDESKKNWIGVPNYYTPPILYLKGLLVDFITDELHFDLNHPVNIIPSYSYDNSVDLIINDGKSAPKLINSRFSATERNKYKIIDRRGNNDTNIYDKGEQFDVDTSLYKKITTIPLLDLTNIGYGGNLSIGTYNFYFKYVDDDGNESDFFAESGLVLIFIGTCPGSVYSGFRDENSHKTISFALSNLDKAYLKIAIYYTRATSDINLNVVVNTYRINTPYSVTNSSLALICITGYEEKVEVPLEEINLQLLRYSASETLDVCLNRLFLAHNYKIKQNYDELRDIALRFIPCMDISKKYTPLDKNYSGNYSETYFDSSFSYKYTGYWSDIYRFGIVFIYSDNTLSDVYNVRGCSNLETDLSFSDVPFWKKSKEEAGEEKERPENGRNYIEYDENNYKIINSSEESNVDNENCLGVILFSSKTPKLCDIIGIKFSIRCDVLKYLRNTLGIKGFFFVRQKRIPTILCLAYTIGIDDKSNVPALPISDKSAYVEGFLNKERIITHEFSSRLYTIRNELVRKLGAICPEYDVNSPYLNSLFTGEEFVVEPYNGESYITNKSRLVDIAAFNDLTLTNESSNVNIIGVEDNTKLVAIRDNKFSARAGEAEEAFRYAYIGDENKSTEATNLVRGSYGPFLGITGYNLMGKLINIRIPHYTEADMSKYFSIRFNDPSPYYAISERYDLYNRYIFPKEIFEVEGAAEMTHTMNPLYRGDCYICNYTHRLNRNFQDPSAPTNEDIVDQFCWANNFEVSDGVVKKENFDNINLGDVNAVLLGTYIHMVIRSNMNLNIRALDDSIPDEIGLTGHPRVFSPYCLNPIDGSYKTPEALCYNKGFEKSVSEKTYYRLADVPYYKEDFTNRISYSNVKITDSFLNGFRTFKGTNYRDYPKTYGSITKIIELRGNLLCVFEHGVGLIPVNERAVAGEGSGGNVYINTANVLPENPKIISDTFGSQWRDSIIKTPRGVYGVDTVGKKIWRTNGETFECISDFRVQEFLNQNISLTERELEPVIGIRNVKTHYNKFKEDVMFTFYDNLYGFEEKVWNLCWNENLQKWITFYSWVPSYSENIYNEYFSFDRNTSKWITKLGVSKHGNDFSDGVTLGQNVIEDSAWKSTLHLSNRNIPKGDGIIHDVEYELVRDNYGNYKLFNDPVRTDLIDEETGLSIWEISLKPGITYEQLCSEYYARVYNDCFLDDLSEDDIKTAPLITSPNTRINLPKGQRTLWKETLGTLKVYKNDRNRRVNLVSKDKDKRVNGDKVVILLNIKAKLKAAYIGDENVTLGEACANGYNDRTFVDEGYYQSVVAVIPKYNMLFLTTDFWKHGQAGIIDIADKIYPTYWYGKQHPFEFEFVVADSPDRHKIFDSLEIISNKAAPESFHYEIVGECYDFAKDKKNMYIRLEATKELYQFNGSDIVFNPDYKDLISEHRPLSPGDPDPQHYDKSTIFPLYYRRQDTINEIEDFYHLYGHKDSYGKGDKNFSALAGAEIVRYENLDEYRIWNHAKAVDVKEHGLLRGNMYYKEDKWYAQINPINIVQKNETKQEWDNRYRRAGEAQQYMVPAECNLFPPPADVLDGKGQRGINLPEDWTRNVVSWPDYQRRNREAKIKDKFIKIRIRYSGEDLAIISAIRTLYSVSYA